MFRFDTPQPLLPDILQLHGHWLGSKDALIFRNERTSWRKFAADLQMMAIALHELGLRQEDRVAVVMSNTDATVTALFGVMTAGGVSVPINLTVTDETLVVMIRDAGASCVIATRDQQSRIDRIRGQLDNDTILISTGVPGNGWLNLNELIAGAKPETELPPIDRQSMLNIVYSSGTTGAAQGNCSHLPGTSRLGVRLALTLRYHSGARTLVTIGLYSNISWVAMLCTLLIGGTLVIREKFDAVDSLEAIEEHGVTHMSMVPIQYQRLHEAQLRLSCSLASVQTPMSCGSALQPELKEALFSMFPHGIIELYGLTEGIITTLQPEDADERWSSVGRPLVGTDIKIIDDQDKEARSGQIGEIVSRGRITMPGYLNREELSLEASWVDADGSVWLRSGDIGRLDEENFLYIVDRKKDMILSGGQNIYPQDIEAVLVKHEGVDDVAVIPAVSERWGETPIALVVVKDPSLEPIDIVDWCNSRVGRHQRLADAILIEELPRNPNGKILKKSLREQYGSLKYS